MKSLKYSIIIITYNEEENISSCIASVRSAFREAQIIVSDGGSKDKTIAIAESMGTEIVMSNPGRGIQFNKGAEKAKGDILLFLHGDSKLPQNAKDILQNYFNDDEIKIGTYRLKFDSSKLIFKIYSYFTRFDSIFTRFGDTCIVVEKNFYLQLGRFKDWPLYEDVEFLRRARRKTKIYSFPAYVETSGRRFHSNGVFKQQIINGWHLIQFIFGKSPANLAEKYNSLRNDKDADTKKKNNNNQKIF